MRIQLDIKNYRCFADSSPVTLIIEPGFVGFVGPNNAGKSTLLKFFYEFRSLFAQIGPSGPSFRGDAITFLDSGRVRDSSELFHDSNDRDLEICLTVCETPDTPTARSDTVGVKFTVSRKDTTCAAQFYKNESAIPPGAFNVGPTGTFPHGSALTTAAGILSNCVYIPAFRHLLPGGPGSDNFDIHVGHSFVAAWNTMKQGKNKGQRETALKVEKRIQEICGLQDLRIDMDAEATTLQLFVDGKPRRLAEVGAGLTQIIILMVTLALREPALILIDEPEASLHPALQIRLMENLGELAKHATLFATHHYGLARSIANRVYTVSREGGASAVREYDSPKSLPVNLGELQYGGYSELGFKKILVVEGTHDLLVFRQWLRKYGKEGEVVVLDGAGCSIKKSKAREPQLRELKRISDAVYVIVDSERTSPGENISWIADFKAVCKACGVRCCVTKRRATENYLTTSAIQDVLGSKFRALGRFGARPDEWPKGRNWRIADRMSKGDLKRTDVGAFLESM